jgi:hypothetical protein
MKSKLRDKDLLALNGAVRALNRSTSRQTLKANLEFLVHHFLGHPAKTLPKHLKP